MEHEVTQRLNDSYCLVLTRMRMPNYYKYTHAYLLRIKAVYNTPPLQKGTLPVTYNNKSEIIQKTCKNTMWE